MIDKRNFLFHNKGMGIPSEVLRNLRQVLLNCGPFSDELSLEAVFVDERIAIWSTQIPDARNKQERVDALIHYLENKDNAQGENGLLLFLDVLIDKVSPDDACTNSLAQSRAALADSLAKDRIIILPPPIRGRSGLLALGLFAIPLLLFLGWLLFRPDPPVLTGCPPSPVFPGNLDLDSEMISVQSASFQMGSDAELPLPHLVTVAAFEIDRYEVTNQQYARFMAETGQEAPPTWEGDSYPYGTAFYPVSGVYWTDARDYCAWAGKRLPFEDEWELACRGTRGNIYPWGDDSLTLANTLDRNCGHTVAVGSFSPHADTPAGLADMNGNVLEWSGSLDVDYPYDSTDGREDLENITDKRVLRGGSFLTPNLSCADRFFSPPRPDEGIKDAGFRCARDLP